MGTPIWTPEGYTLVEFSSQGKISVFLETVQCFDRHVVSFHLYLPVFLKWIFLRLSVQPL